MNQIILHQGHVLPVLRSLSSESVPCVVLDPFGGAMTTALVSAKMERNAIAIELNPEYCKIGAERIRKELGFLVDLSLLQ